MYCNACGKAIADDGRFCTYCGSAVGTPLAVKKLIRYRGDRKIAGVCAGLARYLSLDVVLVRVLVAFITLLSGIMPGVLAYIVAWIIVPEEPETLPVVASGQAVTSP